MLYSKACLFLILVPYAIYIHSLNLQTLQWKVVRMRNGCWVKFESDIIDLGIDAMSSPRLSAVRPFIPEDLLRG